MTKEQEKKVEEAYALLEKAGVSYILVATDPIGEQMLPMNHMARHIQCYNGTPMEMFQMIGSFALQDGHEAIAELLESMFSGNIGKLRDEMKEFVERYKDVN